MSLLPDSATFHEKVQDCFVAYWGHGVSLSAVDLELLDTWAEVKVPVEVIARGIRKAAEAALWDAAHGEGQLRSLRSCKRHVEVEIAKYTSRAIGRPEMTVAPEPFHLVRHHKLIAALKKATKPYVPTWVTQLPPPVSFEQSERQEALALGLLWRQLAPERRSSLLREARALVEKASPMSASTKRESLRFHRAALVRHAWALPSLW
jgi:hypothetical protein